MQNSELGLQAIVEGENPRDLRSEPKRDMHLNDKTDKKDPEMTTSQLDINQVSEQVKFASEPFRRLQRDRCHRLRLRNRCYSRRR